MMLYIITIFIFIHKTLAQAPSSVCSYAVIDTVESSSVTKCRETVQKTGQSESQKINGKKITSADASLKRILDLPLDLAECVFRDEGLITGTAVYTYKKDVFVDKADFKTAAKSCIVSTPGVCPYKDMVGPDKQYCLPDPMLFLKCVRMSLLKPCSGSADVKIDTPVLTTKGPVGAPTKSSAPAGGGDAGGDEEKDPLEGFVEGDKAESAAPAPAGTTAKPESAAGADEGAGGDAGGGGGDIGDIDLS